MNCSLKWQIPKGLDIDAEYRGLLDFQTNVTQAAVEKSTIQKRHDFWLEYFEHFLTTGGEIKGDREYRKYKRKDPDKERQSKRA